MKGLQLLLPENNTRNTMSSWIILLGGTVPVGTEEALQGNYLRLTTNKSVIHAICNLSQYSTQFRAYCTT